MVGFGYQSRLSRVGLIINLMTWKAVLLLVALLVVAESGWVRLSAKFSQLKQQNGWLYLEKIPFKEGVAKFDVEVFVRGKGKSRSHDVYIQGIPQEKWEEEQEKKCKNPVRMPVMINQARMTGQKDRDMFQFSVAKDNTYYFVVKDCFQMFRKDYENDNLTLHVNLRPYNNEVEFDLVPEGQDGAQSQEDQVEEPSIQYEEEPEEVQTLEKGVTEPNSGNEVKTESTENTINEAVEATEGEKVEGSVETVETEIQLVESTPEQSNPAPAPESPAQQL